MSKKKRQSDSSDDNKIVGFLIATIVIVIGFIVLGSIIGPSSPGIGPVGNSEDVADEYETYNNRTFDKRDNLWYTTLNLEAGESIYPFYNHPKDLENISYDPMANTALAVVQSNSGTFSISIDESVSEEEIDFQFVTTAAFNMVRFTAPHFGLQTRIGSSSSEVREELDEDGAEDGLTETAPGVGLDDVSCEDSGPEEFVLTFTVGNETSIEQDMFCSTFTVTNGRDMIDLADLFMYKALGVM